MPSGMPARFQRTPDVKAIKKNQAFRRRSAIEPLERRNLLAVDLVVEQVTDLPELVAGEQITYEIRITNNGPDDAIGATISDPVTESLDDVTWERTVSFQQDADKLNGTNGYWAKASRFQSGVTSVNSIGDVNADGIDDFAVSSNTGLAANGGAVWRTRTYRVRQRIAGGRYSRSHVA